MPARLEEVNFWEGGKGAAIGKGYVLHTDDGGVTWTSTASSAIQGCIAFSIPDEDTAYALTESYRVLKTIDGGASWFTPPAGRNMPAEIYSDLDMMDAWNGMMVGFWVSPGGMGGPNARRTTDGSTWFNCAEPFNGRLTTVRFQDRWRGFVTAHDYDTWLTRNGAVSFWKINTDTAGPVQDVWFIDNFTGYLILADEETTPPLKAVLKTTDQGLNWTTIYLDSSGTDNRLYRRIWFQDELNGYIVGDGGLVMRTNDGGIGWINENSGTTSDFIDAYFLDMNNAVLVGQYGTIARKGQNLSSKQVLPETGMDCRLHPNPCTDRTQLVFTINAKGQIRILLKDPRGITIREICDREFPPSENALQILTSDLQQGFYILEITGKGFYESVPLLVIH